MWLAFNLCMLTLDMCVLSWRSVCLKTRAPSAPVPAAACRWQAVALGDWRGSTRLTGTTTGAAGRLPTSAYWNMRAPGFKGSGEKRTRRWSTAFLISLRGLPAHTPTPPSWEQELAYGNTAEAQQKKKNTPAQQNLHVREKSLPNSCLKQLHFFFFYFIFSIHIFSHSITFFHVS